MTKPRSDLLGSSITVVEVGNSLAAAYCGKLLHQLGARVLRFQTSERSPLADVPPFIAASEGERLSAVATALDAGKEAVVADMRDSAGVAVLDDVLRTKADVVLMSGRLEDWESLGLSPERVRATAPSAVIGRVTMFGDEGPYADQLGGELQTQALGGLMNMIGEPEAEPLRIGGYPAQYSTGLALLDGVALGLFHRDRTGEGSLFVTSVIETVAHMEWKTALTYQAEAVVAQRGWRHDPPMIVRCRDGFFAFFYLTSDWPKVVEIVGDKRLDDEKFSTQAGRNAHRDELESIVGEFTQGLGKVDLYHRTQAVRLTTGYMATMGDLFVDAQYGSRSFLEPIDIPGVGTGLLPGAPWRWFETAAEQRSAGTMESDVAS